MKNETMIRRGRLFVAVVAAAFLSGCATIAGGLVGTGVGIMVDAAPRSTVPRS